MFKPPSFLFSFILFVFMIATSVMAYEKGDTVTLTLNPTELREDGGKILFEPDRRRKLARYVTYTFDAAQFKEKLGDYKKLTKSMQVSVKITEVITKNHTPSKGASPIGGFNLRYYTVEILKVIGPVE